MAKPEDKNQENALRWKRNQLDYLLGYAKHPTFAELGCGTGFVAGIIAERFVRSKVIGIDRNPLRLASLKTIPRTSAICGDIRSVCLRDESVDSALIVSTLHEVYSESGKIGIAHTLGSAARALKHGGRLILYDRVRPEPRRVMIDFIDPDQRVRFTRFARDFRMRKVEYIEEGSEILLDIADAFEFIEQFALETGDDWNTKLGETNFFFTGKEYSAACSRAGLEIYRATIWEEAYGTPEKLADKMIIDTLFTRAWIGLVVEKGGGARPDDLL